MKRFSTFVGLILTALFGGCSQVSVSSNEIIGIWRHEDGAEFQFFGDGRFVAGNFPDFLLFGPSQSAVTVSGQGKWQLVDVSGYLGPQIKLRFDEIGNRKDGFEIPVFTSGNGKSLKLFFWKGEEGGERFEFQRDITTKRK